MPLGSCREGATKSAGLAHRFKPAESLSLVLQPQPKPPPSGGRGASLPVRSDPSVPAVEGSLRADGAQWLAEGDWVAGGVGVATISDESKAAAQAVSKLRKVVLAGPESRAAATCLFQPGMSALVATAAG